MRRYYIVINAIISVLCLIVALIFGGEVLKYAAILYMAVSCSYLGHSLRNGQDDSKDRLMLVLFKVAIVTMFFVVASLILMKILGCALMLEIIICAVIFIVGGLIAVLKMRRITHPE